VGLDVVGDDVLPASRLAVGLVPLEADHVDQEPLGQPVPAHHLLRQLAAAVGELDHPAAAAHVAILFQPVQHLGDRGGRAAQALGDASLDDRCALFVQGVHGLEVLLDRGVVATFHAVSLPGRGPQNPGSGACGVGLS